MMRKVQESQYQTTVHDSKKGKEASAVGNLFQRNEETKNQTNVDVNTRRLKHLHWFPAHIVILLRLMLKLK